MPRRPKPEPRGTCRVCGIGPLTLNEDGICYWCIPAGKRAQRKAERVRLRRQWDADFDRQIRRKLRKQTKPGRTAFLAGIEQRREIKSLEKARAAYQKVKQQPILTRNLSSDPFDADEWMGLDAEKYKTSICPLG